MTPQTATGSGTTPIDAGSPSTASAGERGGRGKGGRARGAWGRAASSASRRSVRFMQVFILYFNGAFSFSWKSTYLRILVLEYPNLDSVLSRVLSVKSIFVLLVCWNLYL